MPQPQKAPRQTKDPYAQRGKQLASAVQQRRGWVGSDPSRQPELADALVELTGHRLRGHAFAAAAADAQDSVRQAAQLLTAHGPVGAYTEAVDAARYDTAVVQLASVQLGIGLAESAGRTIASLDELHEQFLTLGLELPLAPEVVVRALVCTAAGALAAGEVSRANAAADDAQRHLVAAGLHDEPEAAYLALDVDRGLADARWAADRPADALGHLHSARDRWVEIVAGRLDAPAGLSPSLVERLTAPAFWLHRDLADRLMATGEFDLGLVTRRDLVGLLGRLDGRLAATARSQPAAALADLAADLLTADRTEEAEAVSVEALAADGRSADPGWPALVRARVLVRTGQPEAAVTLLRSRPLPADPSPVGLLLQQVLAESHRAAGEPAEAAAAERAAEAIATQLGVDGPTGLVERVRGVVSRGRTPVSWPSAGTTVWDRLVPAAAVDEVDVPVVEGSADWLAADRAEAHRREEERARQVKAEADRREAEQQAVARQAAEEAELAGLQAAEEERAEDERRQAAEETERQETKRRREERLEAYRVEAEQRAAELAEAERQELARHEPEGIAPDDFAAATGAWREARESSDRRANRAAAERLADLLRPRALDAPALHGPLLQQVLSELAGLRMRGGDLLGARSASREAKDVGRRLGR